MDVLSANRIDFGWIPEESMSYKYGTGGITKLVYVIDDHPSVRAAVKKTLEWEGYPVEVFENGEELFEAISVCLPDLILLDMFMPEPDGFEVLRKIKDKGLSIPIIAMSGGGPMPIADIFEISRWLGVKRTLAKPFGRRDLVDAVEGCLLGIPDKHREE